MNNSCARCGERCDIAGACGGNPVGSGSSVRAERDEKQSANRSVAKEERKRLSNDKQITIYNKAGFVLGKHLQWFPEVHPHVWAQCSRMSKAFRSPKEIALIFVGNRSYFCRVMSIRCTMGEVVYMQKPLPKTHKQGMLQRGETQHVMGQDSRQHKPHTE